MQVSRQCLGSLAARKAFCMVHRLSDQCVHDDRQGRRGEAPGEGGLALRAQDQSILGDLHNGSSHEVMIQHHLTQPHRRVKGALARQCEHHRDDLFLQASRTNALRQSGLAFPHFDLLQIDGREALEKVWFDEPLDEFRKVWVEKWGNFSTVGPARVNTVGYLRSRTGRSGRPRTSYLVFAGGEAKAATPDSGFDTWQLDELVRKDWALGPAEPGESLRMPLSAGHELGFEYFHLKFVDGASDFDAAQGSLAAGASPIFLGELIASPD